MNLEEANLEKMSPDELQEYVKKIHEQDMKKSQVENTKEISKGLGDTIKKATDFLGIPQCGGCKERQEMLNKKFPYKKK